MRHMCDKLDDFRKIFFAGSSIEMFYDHFSRVRYFQPKEEFSQ